MINATISAAYYLKIIATMWAKPDPTADVSDSADASAPCICSPPLGIALTLCVTATVVFGVALPLTAALWNVSSAAAMTFLGNR